MYNVLLVDPDRLSRDAIKHMIDWPSYGFIIQASAGTISDTLSLINKDVYRLIVLNLTEITFDGLELCARIRKVSQTPILLVGGEKDFNFVRHAISLQVNDYLPGPIQPNECISSLLKIKQTIEDQSKISFYTKRTTAYHRRDANIIDAVKSYVEHSIHKQITLKEISNHLHYNCSYLGQKFKCHEKITFNQYLLNRRMEKAQFLLDHTNMKIYEVAYEVGYTDLDWFYKKFKAHTGVSASKYRDKHYLSFYEKQYKI
ncbi:helix-turn-helix domain-containing protein [Amphibacillus jilinensis]|uniref:response regulator transcription factor n=1 Tax=Amphibacillus jilinensis TaxID=1216008 RepID=UPI0002F63BB1|nr:helix-turn-helix domain-containing protein [Amphibacillus jilinensis]